MTIEFTRAHYDHNNHNVYLYLRNPNAGKVLIDTERFKDLTKLHIGTDKSINVEFGFN